MPAASLISFAKLLDLSFFCSFVKFILLTITTLLLSPLPFCVLLNAKNAGKNPLTYSLYCCLKFTVVKCPLGLYIFKRKTDHLKHLLNTTFALSSFYNLLILYQFKLPFATSKDYPQTSNIIIPYFLIILYDSL